MKLLNHYFNLYLMRWEYDDEKTFTTNKRRTSLKWETNKFIIYWLPILEENQELKSNEINYTKHTTKPPSRYTESKLINLSLLYAF